MARGQKGLEVVEPPTRKGSRSDVATLYFRRKPYRDWARAYRPALALIQNDSHRRLTEALASGRYGRLTKEINAWLRSIPWQWTVAQLRFEPAGQYSRTRLLAWRMLISEEGQHLRTLRGKELHRLRIRCKRYRYIVAMLQSLGSDLEQPALEFAETAKRGSPLVGRLA